MKSVLDENLKISKSYDKLRQVNLKIPERRFHDHGHILYDIRSILGSSKKTFVEIGSYVGHTSCLILNHEYETHVYCIDPLNLNKEHYNGYMDQETTLVRNLNKFTHDNNKYTVLKGFSNDGFIINKLIHDNIMIDILYIDGDHAYQGVINDFNLYESFVNPGGFIIFDDYKDYIYSSEVKTAVDSIVSNLPSSYEIIGCLPNYQHAYACYDLGSLNGFILYKKL